MNVIKNKTQMAFMTQTISVKGLGQMRGEAIQLDQMRYFTSVMPAPVPAPRREGIETHIHQRAFMVPNHIWSHPRA